MFGVTTGEAEAVTGASVGVGGGDAGTGGSSAGGGRSGSARPSRRYFLRAAISWRRAMFSDLEEPSSERMASIRRSRSAMSPSRVVMYSRMGEKRVQESEEREDLYDGHESCGH